MTMYEDLPKDLKKYFGDSSIPPEIRQVISNGWEQIDREERQLLTTKLQKAKKAPLKCILLAVMETTSVLLTKPQPEELQL